MKTLFSQITDIPKNYLENKLKDFLKEDMHHLDLSTKYIPKEDKSFYAHLIAEEDLIFVGQPIIKELFKKADITFFYQDGQECRKGATICSMNGDFRELLSKERVLLNLIQRLSGVASLTNQYVKHVNKRNIKILDTRKTTPGIRLFEKYAVKMGGGHNHRLNLNEGIMIKDNHLVTINSTNEILKTIKKKHPEKKIEIEVDHFDQIVKLRKETNTNVDAILLDNMNEKEIEKCAQYIRKQFKNCFIEASGGINLKNINRYKDLDVDGISIGALTHQAVSKNIKLEFKKNETN